MSAGNERAPRTAGWEQAAPETIRDNIRRVVALEEASARRRTRVERGADAVAGFVGTLPFVGLHVAAVALWLAINLRGTPLRPFDPYPFSLLSTVASLEAVILTAFILMKQRRMSRLADRRDHLDLQVNLLTEREVSLLIEMVGALGERLGAPVASDEALGLSRTSATEHLVEELHRHLPDADPPAP